MKKNIIPRNEENLHKIIIDKLIFGPRALGHFENGMKVFVSKILPNEEALIYITKKYKDYAEGKIDTLTKISEKRITPSCKYFDQCGGCQLQHTTYENQIYWKQKFLEENLIHITKISEKQLKKILLPIIPAKENTQYRNKTEIAFGYNKENTEIKVGFHVADKKWDLLMMNECLLQSNNANKALNALGEIAQKTSLNVFSQNKKSKKLPWSGMLKYTTLRTNYEDKILIAITTHKDIFPKEEQKLWLDIFQKHLGDSLHGLLQISEHQQKGVPTTYTTHKIYGKETLPDQIGDLKFHIGPRSFLQVNRNMAIIMIEKLAQKIQEVIKIPLEECHILDLFCGNGFLGMSIAKKVKQVTGIEINESAVDEGKENMKLNTISNYTFHKGDANKVLSILLKEKSEKYDIAIIDPPRAGLGKNACNTLLQTQAPYIIYISCNPSTLARDLLQLQENGYSIHSTQGLDMFPQTYHLESITVLVKN
jgi:23S rRNA (uracil1939-C5)-methyltransferase